MFSTFKTTLLALTLTGGLLSGLCFAADPVDINTASAQDIAVNLNGIGDSKAAAIVAYREQNGPFEHADELVNVRGIGLTTVDKNRELIVVDTE